MTATIFSYPLMIKEYHLDTFGHVNNATYLNLFEEARWEIITQNGFGLKKIQETGIGPVVLELKVNFLHELRLRDNVIIETQLTSYAKKIATLSQRMLSHNEVCCTAEFVVALFDLKMRKIIMPTPEWLKALGVNV